MLKPKIKIGIGLVITVTISVWMGVRSRRDQRDRLFLSLTVLLWIFQSQTLDIAGAGCRRITSRRGWAPHAPRRAEIAQDHHLDLGQTLIEETQEPGHGLGYVVPAAPLYKGPDRSPGQRTPCRCSGPWRRRQGEDAASPLPRRSYRKFHRLPSAAPGRARRTMRRYPARRPKLGRAPDQPHLLDHDRVACLERQGHEKRGEDQEASQEKQRTTIAPIHSGPPFGGSETRAAIPRDRFSCRNQSKNHATGLAQGEARASGHGRSIHLSGAGITPRDGPSPRLTAGLWLFGPNPDNIPG